MIGRVIKDRYRLEAYIGGGGMAVVYRGVDLMLERPVAIKRMRPEFRQDELFVRRFYREAQAAARISHPNVVAIYDLGEDADGPFIIMEYVAGETLKARIDRAAPLSPEEIVSIGTQILDALSNAHRADIIHRDIKPHNILIDTSGRVKVTDFGIARAVTAQTITDMETIFGSVHYFSPEQARGGVIGATSDLYSLGVVLYEMATGRVPFNGDSPVSVALQHIEAPLPAPRQFNPHLPRPLENVILRALAKHSEDRYPDAQAMRRDLATALDPARAGEPPFVPGWQDGATQVFARLDHHSDAEGTNHGEPIGHAVEQADVDGADRAGFGGTTDEAENDLPEERSKGSGGRSRSWWQNRRLRRGVTWTFLALVLVFGVVTTGKMIAGAIYVPDVLIPDVIGEERTAAETKLKDLGMTVEVEEQYDENVPEGLVISQTPAPGEKAKRGTPVGLIVSLGPRKIEMPSVVGLNVRTAEERLLDFQHVNITETYDDQAEQGTVIEQTPEAGTLVVPKTAEVMLVVSKGKRFFEMPDLVGLTREQAESLLIKNDLVLKSVREEPSYFPKGYVFAQWPVKAGQNVTVGQEITLSVSSGLKSDALIVDYPISVLAENGKETNVAIFVRDARFDTARAIVQETVRGPKEFSLELVLSPSRDATIEVYENGVLTRQKTVRYVDVVSPPGFEPPANENGDGDQRGGSGAAGDRGLGKKLSRWAYFALWKAQAAWAKSGEDERRR